eukprot:638849-Pleurochrysis_carterae.AAC.2
MIRWLMAEKAAEADARGQVGPRVRPGEGRRLSFDDPAPDAGQAPCGGDAGAYEDTVPPRARNVRSELADEFGKLRPRGAETLPAAE